MSGDTSIIHRIHLAKRVGTSNRWGTCPRYAHVQFKWHRAQWAALGLKHAHCQCTSRCPGQAYENRNRFKIPMRVAYNINGACRERENEEEEQRQCENTMYDEDGFFVCFTSETHPMHIPITYPAHARHIRFFVFKS